MSDELRQAAERLYEYVTREIDDFTDEAAALDEDMGEELRQVLRDTLKVCKAYLAEHPADGVSPQAKLDFLKSKGLTVSLAKEADNEPYLAYVIENGSELCDLETVSKLMDAELLITKLRGENDVLRASLANGPGPCVYCELPKAEWSKCRQGFPGCGRADDAMLCPHFGAVLQLDAINPADGDVPIDEAWLSLIGGRHTSYGHVFEYDGKEVFVQAYEGRRNKPRNKWRVSIESDGETITLRDVTTRNELRRLLAALGVV